MTHQHAVYPDLEGKTVAKLDADFEHDTSRSHAEHVAKLVENARGPVKGIIGPWVHQYPHTAVPGPQIGFLQLAVRWWDRWLKGIDNGADADPACRAYMLHSEAPNASAKQRAGHWVAEAAWPSPRVTAQRLFLGEGAGALPPRPLVLEPMANHRHPGVFFPR